jgi:hypothetical protein
MTDERITEYFEKWKVTDPTHEELKILKEDDCDLSRVTFYAGFKTAERLAKIEVLEDVREIFLSNGSKITTMVKLERIIKELKEYKR